MNYWTRLSVEYANQRNYLDHLFRVYPTIPDGIRDIDPSLWNRVESSFSFDNNIDLIRNLLALDLFPIKDSYVAYLKRDSTSVLRNPETINRLAGRIREMGLAKLYEKCSEPKETNRQIGPLFKNWISSGNLGVPVLNQENFLAYQGNAVLDASDNEMMTFARQHLNYQHTKGLDFIGKFNGHYVIGEAKFITDFGGHQNAQFVDAMTTLTQVGVNAIIIAILDGVLYIPNQGKLYRSISETYNNHYIMSSLVLRDFLFSL